MLPNPITPATYSATVSIGPPAIPPRPQRRRRLPVEQLDLVAACNRVLAKTTDPKRRAALESLTFHLLRARQKAKGGAK